MRYVLLRLSIGIAFIVSALNLAAQEPPYHVLNNVNYRQFHHMFGWLDGDVHSIDRSVELTSNASEVFWLMRNEERVKLFASFSWPVVLSLARRIHNEAVAATIAPFDEKLVALLRDRYLGLIRFFSDRYKLDISEHIGKELYEFYLSFPHETSESVDVWITFRFPGDTEAAQNTGNLSQAGQTYFISADGTVSSVLYDEAKLSQEQVAIRKLLYER